MEPVLSSMEPVPGSIEPVTGSMEPVPGSMEPVPDKFKIFMLNSDPDPQHWLGLSFLVKKIKYLVWTSALLGCTAS